GLGLKLKKHLRKKRRCFVQRVVNVNPSNSRPILLSFPISQKRRNKEGRSLAAFPCGVVFMPAGGIYSGYEALLLLMGRVASRRFLPKQSFILRRRMPLLKIHSKLNPLLPFPLFP